MSRQPTLYIPHGGGPCFFMEWTMGPPDTWNALEEWLRGFPATLPEAPRALLVISAHWETQGFTVTSPHSHRCSTTTPAFRRTPTS